MMFEKVTCAVSRIMAATSKASFRISQLAPAWGPSVKLAVYAFSSASSFPDSAMGTSKLICLSSLVIRCGVINVPSLARASTSHFGSSAMACERPRHNRQPIPKVFTSRLPEMSSRAARRAMLTLDVRSPRVPHVCRRSLRSSSLEPPHPAWPLPALRLFRRVVLLHERHRGLQHRDPLVLAGQPVILALPAQVFVGLSST